MIGTVAGADAGAVADTDTDAGAVADTDTDADADADTDTDTDTGTGRGNALSGFAKDDNPTIATITFYLFLSIDAIPLMIRKSVLPT